VHYTNRDHVDRDIEPYVCLSESCNDPLCFFETSHSWKEHMQRQHTLDWAWKIHLAVWQCDLAPADPQHIAEFHDKESFLAHLSAAHSGNLSRAQILARGRRAKTIQIRDPFTCPLCDCQPEEVVPHLAEKPYELLSKHIARHLKALAFISLSYLDSIEYGSEPSNKGTPSTGSRLEAAEKASVRDDCFDEIPPTENDTDPNSIAVMVGDLRFSVPELLIEPVAWPVLASRHLELSHDPVLETFAAAMSVSQTVEEAGPSYVVDSQASDIPTSLQSPESEVSDSQSWSALRERLIQRQSVRRVQY
jgi:hypothetical protein